MEFYDCTMTLHILDWDFFLTSTGELSIIFSEGWRKTTNQGYFMGIQVLAFFGCVSADLKIERHKLVKYARSISDGYFNPN